MKTYLRRSLAGTQDAQACSPGAWASTHPYLDWLFHTLVEEVERTGPLHPEGKEGLYVPMEELGKRGRGSGRV